MLSFCCYNLSRALDMQMRIINDSVTAEELSEIFGLSVYNIRDILRLLHEDFSANCLVTPDFSDVFIRPCFSDRVRRAFAELDQHAPDPRYFPEYVYEPEINILAILRYIQRIHGKNALMHIPKSLNIHRIRKFSSPDF